MGPPSYVRSVFDRNVVMRRITVLSSPCQSNKRYHAPSTQRKKKPCLRSVAALKMETNVTTKRCQLPTRLHGIIHKAQ